MTKRVKVGRDGKHSDADKHHDKHHEEHHEHHEDHKGTEEKQPSPKEIESGLADLVKKGMELQQEFLKDPEAVGNSNEFEHRAKELKRAAKDFKNRYHLEDGQKTIAKYIKNLAEELND